MIIALNTENLHVPIAETNDPFSLSIYFSFQEIVKINMFSFLHFIFLDFEIKYVSFR